MQCTRDTGRQVALTRRQSRGRGSFWMSDRLAASILPGCGTTHRLPLVPTVLRYESQALDLFWSQVSSRLASSRVTSTRVRVWLC